MNENVKRNSCQRVFPRIFLYINLDRRFDLKLSKILDNLLKAELFNGIRDVCHEKPYIWAHNERIFINENTTENCQRTVFLDFEKKIANFFFGKSPLRRNFPRTRYGGKLHEKHV